MKEQALSLNELAARIKASDHGAFASLFKQMHTPLLRYVFRITKDESMCLDVLQDVFAKLWEKRKDLEIRISAKALLYTMARNQALNAIRRESKHTEASSLSLLEFQDKAPTADTSLNARQLDDWFKKWINEMPPRRAEAFILSRHHGLSHHEISNIMGLSKRTIDTHIVHALKFLRTRFDKLQNQEITP